MKPILSILLAALFTGCFSISFSQSKKFLFSRYPANISCTAVQLSKLFSAEKGQQVSLKLSENFKLEGPVSNKISKYNNTLQTVVIQLPAFNNMLLAISKRVAANNQTVYIGHLYNSESADGYQLKQHEDNTYQFVKIETDKVLQPCNQ
jgi:hypothetical protein